MIFILQAIFGILYANFVEWFSHRYILHNLGSKDKDTLWAFHWNHHREVTQNDYYDKNYEDSVVTNKNNFLEFGLLVVLMILHLPLLFLFPVFYVSSAIYTIGFYYIHSRSHKYPEWGKKYFPWHYDHHMKCPKHNWCVTLPITDALLGTYKK